MGAASAQGSQAIAVRQGHGGGFEQRVELLAEAVPAAQVGEQASTMAYVAEDGRLLWNELLDGFMAYWKENAEWMLQRQPYSEAASQLVLSAWLHRIVNGGAEVEARPAGVAAIDREYAVGSGRVDLLVRWPLSAEAGGGVERFAAEIKVRRDSHGEARLRRDDGDPKDEGLEQISEYLGRLGMDEGTLVLFDQRGDAPPIAERCSRREQVYGGRRITVLRL